MPPLAVLFDMDGVLVDTNPFHKLAFAAFLRQYDRTLTDEQLRTHVYGKTNREGLRYIFGDALTPEQTLAREAEKEALFRDIYRPHLSSVAGLVPLLQALQARGIPMAVGTSAPAANLDFVLDGLHLRSYFAALVDSANVTEGKPHPQVYLLAAERLGVPPARCVVIEDSLAGVAAGRRAGMKVVGVTTTHSPAELADTDLVISDFTELTVDQLLNLVA